MLFFIRQVLGIDTNYLSTFVTIVGEHIFVALDTIGMVIP